MGPHHPSEGSQRVDQPHLRFGAGVLITPRRDRNAVSSSRRLAIGAVLITPRRDRNGFLESWQSPDRSVLITPQGDATWP